MSFLFHDTEARDVFTREDLSPAQQMFGRIAEDFMRSEVLPRAEQIYAKDWAVTRELLRKAGDLDLLRIDIPEEYDGLGLDKVSSSYVGEKIGVMPSFAGSLGAHTTIGTLPLVYFGTAEQKRRYLPRLAAGEMIAAFCLTEAGSGSDALAARTRATLDGDHYVLNGQKMWITNGGFADLFTIFAKVDGEKFTAFLVERGMGVVSGREEPKLGLDGSSTTALILENVRVPVGNVLGTIGEGHKVAFNVLNIGRLKLGTRNIGSAKQSLNRAIEYAQQRHQFGKPIASFGMIRQKLAEMAIRCYVGDAMVYRTLGDADRAIERETDVLRTIESFAVECSINKVWTSETLAYVVDEAVQVYGGYGYSKEYPAERAFRDARITRLYEGTNEINRLIIPTRLKKLTRAIETRDPRKRLVLGMLASVRPDSDQEVLGHIADAAIETYAIESAHLRAEKRRHAVIPSVSDASNDIPGDGTTPHPAFGHLLPARRGEKGQQSRAAPDSYPSPLVRGEGARRADEGLSSSQHGPKRPSTARDDSVVRDIVAVYTSDATTRIWHAARQVAAATGHRELATDAEQLIASEPLDTVAARKRIATAVIDAGRYLW